MPAFQLTHLKAQISEQLRLYTRPIEFRRGLRDLLEFYADRGYRAGEEVFSISFISSYRVPPLVMNHLEHSLEEMSRENPFAGLALADELWKDDFSEPRLLAVKLLGGMPLALMGEVDSRLRSWIQPGMEEQTMDSLLKYGGFRMRHEADLLWLVLVESWTAEEDVKHQRFGLRAMKLAIQDEGFQNTPPFFRMLIPLIQACPKSLHDEILEVLESLTTRIPSETVYFIRQQALNPLNSKETIKLLRQCLPFFNYENRALLREVF